MAAKFGSQTIKKQLINRDTCPGVISHCEHGSCGRRVEEFTVGQNGRRDQVVCARSSQYLSQGDQQ